MDISVLWTSKWAIAAGPNPEGYSPDSMIVTHLREDCQQK